MKLNLNTHNFTPAQHADALISDARTLLRIGDRRITIVMSLDSLFFIDGLSQVDYLDIEKCIGTAYIRTLTDAGPMIKIIDRPISQLS